MKLNTPIRVILSLTDRCNLSCQFCNAHQYASAKQQMSIGDALSLLDQLKEWGVMIVVLSGGEPLLHPDFLQIARSAVVHRFFVYLTSNGTFIDQKLAKKLCEIGIHSVQISLDGPVDVHKTIRRSDHSFSDAVKAIKCCLHVGIPTSIMCTLSQVNVQYIGEVIELGMAMGVGTCGFERMVSAVRGKETGDLSLTNQQLKFVIQSLTQKRKELRKKVHIECSDPLMNLPPETKKSKDENKSIGGCVAGIAACLISSNGTVYPCTRLPLPLGNIAETTIEEIWQRSEVLKLLRNRDQLSGKCGKCMHRFLCGGCRAAAFAKYGDFLTEDPGCFL